MAARENSRATVSYKHGYDVIELNNKVTTSVLYASNPSSNVRDNYVNILGPDYEFGM